MQQTHSVEIPVERGDVSEAFADLCYEAGRVAWDIETTGLDWSKDLIGTCQIAADDHIVVIQLDGQTRPQRMMGLLEDSHVRKVFHHAPFDVRFMAHQWGVAPANLACTKVASKILNPKLPTAEHSLMPVLLRTLGVKITKDQRLSDWRSSSLTTDQLRYASDDVRYLVRLLDAQLHEAEQHGVVDDLEASFAYLPTRVSLDLLGVGDVFTY